MLDGLPFRLCYSRLVNHANDFIHLPFLSVSVCAVAFYVIGGINRIQTNNSVF